LRSNQWYRIVSISLSLASLERLILKEKEQPHVHVDEVGNQAHFFREGWAVVMRGADVEFDDSAFWASHLRRIARQDTLQRIRSSPWLMGWGGDELPEIVLLGDEAGDPQGPRPKC
jgi:hypothetical protein